MSKKDKIVILIGMPGAGKGSISTLMKWLPNVAHVSVGELIRRLDSESDLGKKVHAIQASGMLVDDDTVNEVFAASLPGFIGKDLLLDGYPRTIGQAKWIFDNLKDKFDIISFLINLDEKTATFRRDKRINDYLIRGEEPRKDDIDPTVLPRRFAEYREKTEPTVEFLRKELGDKFFEVDGRPTLEDVYESIMRI
jgi:adenylate kinase